MIPLIQPFMALPCPVMAPQIRIPKMDKRKNSQLVNIKDIAVRSGVRERTKTTLIMVPIQEEVVATKIARPPFPLFANGNPSKAVAAEAGVPGIFRRIADWQPPDTAPT